MKNFMMTTAIIASGATTAFATENEDSLFRTQADATEIHASDFIGMRVYTSEAELAADEYEGAQAEWEDVGEINDVVLSRDGTISSVLVDIGGFIGIGERQVAMDMTAVKFVSDSSTSDDPDDFFLVVKADRVMLEEAPVYSRYDETMSDDHSEMALIKKDGYETAKAEFLTTENLTGAAVYDAEDNHIGEVSSLLLGDDTQIQKAVIDVGGFLGMGEKPVALDLEKLNVLRAQDGDEIRVHVSMTKAELEAMKTYEE